MYVSVVIQNSTREFDKFYDYIVPDNMKDCIRPGVRVIVPFGKGNRLCEAFVMAVKETSEFSGLKEISQIIDETPVLSDELIELSKYMRKRYVCTYDMAIRCMLPTGLGLLFREDVILMSADRVDLDRMNRKLLKYCLTTTEKYRWKILRKLSTDL